MYVVTDCATYVIYWFFLLFSILVNQIKIVNPRFDTSYSIWKCLSNILMYKNYQIQIKQLRVFWILIKSYASLSITWYLNVFISIISNNTAIEQLWINSQKNMDWPTGYILMFTKQRFVLFNKSLKQKCNRCYNY